MIDAHTNRPSESLLPKIILIMAGGIFLSWLMYIMCSPSLYASRQVFSNVSFDSVALFTLLCLIAQFACVLLSRWADCIARNKLFLPIISIMLSLGMVLFLIGHSTSDQVNSPSSLAVVGTLLVALGSAFVYAIWIMCSSYFKSFDILAITTAIFTVSVIIGSLLLILPAEIQVVIAVAMPLLFGTLLIWFKAVMDPEPSQALGIKVSITKKHIGLFILQFFGTFLYGLSTQLVRSSDWLIENGNAFIASSLYHSAGILTASIVVAIILLITVLQKRSMPGVMFAAIVPIVIAVGVLLPSIFNDISFNVANFIVGIGIGSFQILLYSCAAIVTRRTGISSFITFGVPWSAMGLASLVGQYMRQYLENAMLAGIVDWSGIASLVIFTLLLASLIVFFPLYRVLFANKTGLLVSEDHTQVRNGAPLQGDAVFKAHGLTPREREIAVLLSRGRSLPFIEKELYISRGTVNTHVRHIYEKLEVHSKQEFLSKIEQGTNSLNL